MVIKSSDDYETCLFGIYEISCSISFVELDSYVDHFSEEKNYIHTSVIFDLL